MVEAVTFHRNEGAMEEEGTTGDSEIGFDFGSKIERRMNCLFITAGGRKVRVFELVSCSDQCPHPPQPPLPPKGEGRGGGLFSDVVLFRLHLNNFTLLLLQKKEKR